VKKFQGVCRGKRRANKTFCTDGLKGMSLCSSSRLNLQPGDGSLDLIYTKASIFGGRMGLFLFFCFSFLLPSFLLPVRNLFVVTCLARAIGLAIPVYNNLTLDKIEMGSVSLVFTDGASRARCFKGSIIVFLPPQC